MSMRLRPLTSAAALPWMDKGALPYRCDAAPVSDAGQFPMNIDSAQNARAIPHTTLKRRLDVAKPNQVWRNKRI
jgi:hypothetical protein